MGAHRVDAALVALKHVLQLHALHLRGWVRKVLAGGEADERAARRAATVQVRRRPFAAPARVPGTLCGSVLPFASQVAALLLLRCAVLCGVRRTRSIDRAISARSRLGRSAAPPSTGRCHTVANMVAN